MVIYFMIQSARDEHSNEPIKHHLLNVLCYLSNNVDIKSMNYLDSLGHFRNIGSSFIDQPEQIDAICDFCTDISTIDHLIDFMDKLKTVFEIDPTATSNNLNGPNKISPTSSLGIFVRRVSSYWECMSFEAQCVIAKEFIFFCSSVDIPVDLKTQDTSTLDCEFISIFEESDSEENTPETIEFAEATQTFLLNNDITSAEKRVHNFFDTLSHDPLAIRYRGQDVKSLDVLLQELRLLEAGRSSSFPKHQFAMMTLALIWVGAGNFTMAQTAVEEALKSSHQRGDHPSVVKSLLLLFHIMQKSGNFDTIRGEELLHRCIAKGGALGLNELVADAVLTFATLKIGQLNQLSTDVSRTKNSSLESESNVDWSFEEIWNLLSFELHGESSLTVQYCLRKDSGQIDDVAAPIGPGVLQHPGKVVTEAFNPVNERYAEFTFRSFLLYCELWSRMHLFNMAVLYCNRAINLFVDHVKPHYILRITSKLIFSKINCIFQRHENDCQDSTGGTRLNESLNALYKNFKQIQSSLHSKYHFHESLNKVNNGFKLLSNYLSIFMCINACDHLRSLRFAEAMMDSLGDELLFHGEDRMRCTITKLVVESVLSGVRQRVILSNVDKLCDEQSKHLSNEPSIMWLASKAKCR
jgi:hypothetical protein